MTKNRSSANKGVFCAAVCANRQIGQPAASSGDESRRGKRFYRLRLEFTGAGAEAKRTGVEVA